MAVVDNLLRSVKALFLNQSTTISNIVATLIVFGLEALISSEKLFDCPCRESAEHCYYGWAFIFAPALIFFILSMLISDKFRKLAQGCCHPVPNQADRWCSRCPCTTPHRDQCSEKMVRIFLQSLVASCLWIFWAFFQGEYYACTKLGNKDFKLKKANAQTNNTAKQIIEDEFREAYDNSQFISLVILCVLLGASFLGLMIYHCCYQSFYSSIPKPEKYRKLEAKAAAKAFKEKMEEFAQNEGKRQAEMFFNFDQDVQRAWRTKWLRHAISTGPKH